MAIDPRNALVDRRIVEDHGDVVVIEETWDVTHPDSPIVVFEPSVATVSLITEMTRREFDEARFDLIRCQ